MIKKINQFYASLLLKQKVKVLFLLILAVYMISFVVIFNFFLHKQIYEYAKENALKNVRSIGDRLVADIENINSFSRILMINQNVNSYLDSESPENISEYVSAVNSIYEIQNAYPEVSSAIIFRSDGNSLMVGQGIIKVNDGIANQDEWREEINQRDGGYVLRINGGGAFVLKYEAHVVSLIRNINDIGTYQSKGVLCVNFPISILENTYMENDTSGKYYAYLDQDGEIICQNQAFNYKISQKNIIGENESGISMDGGVFNKTVYSYYKIPKTPFTLIYVEEISFFKNLSKEEFLVISFLVVLTIMVLSGINVFISVYITTPIQKLVDSMAGVKKGWLRRVSMNHGNDEIGILKDSYNKMILETSQLIEQLVDKEKSIRKAEIDILQEQIKPHFLYNTIEMIACLSFDGSREEIYDALETLGSFYRQFLSKGSTDVTLATEIAIIKDYLKIEKLRYGDIFTDVYMIDESCLDIRLPKLMLQPLVENSLYHGIRPKGEKGVIRISVFREKNTSNEDVVVIEIYDDGIGLSKENLKQIMDENNKGFGFKKTIERFLYFTDNRGSYEISSREGEYTRIRLCIK